MNDFAVLSTSLIDDELAWLNKLIAAMEGGMVVTNAGVDVTALELAAMKPMVAYLEAVLLRLNHSIN